jgi:hypothetical protein
MVWIDLALPGEQDFFRHTQLMGGTAIIPVSPGCGMEDFQKGNLGD